MTTQSEVAQALCILCERVIGETNVDQMFKQISVFARIFNCSSIAYGCRTPVPNVERKSRRKLPTISTYPKEWQEHCLKSGYDRLDPGVGLRRSQSLPLLWDDAYKDPNTTDRERRIFDEAKEFGLRTGVTIPLRGRLGTFPTMSFVQTETSDLSNSAVCYLWLAALFVHIMVERSLDLNADVPSLTARETECISWVPKGKSSWDIGAILGISPNTVDFHIKHVLKKLDTTNRMVAAMEAEQLGLIEPQFWLL
ncbi:LuxR family transcriptional regulator [Sinorhizobium meliloti]|uniref:helix-turn-helix transcriptional regulator n=1 Tax=Rhizobium meliloti TaxID=382 RepID=UPI000FD9E7F8|nr:LuxR family transcriptional regulator [Sinorhizobium meliloti]RVI58377.1 LuxR family transcriptional regulator [Sinorhizobium meliloti]